VIVLERAKEHGSAAGATALNFLDWVILTLVE
jgi:hypothetical protein